MAEQSRFSVELSNRAKKALKRLDKVTIYRILDKLDEMAQTASAPGHYALRGELKGLYRESVGDYRIIYWIDHEIRLVKVELIGHRRDIYGKLRRRK